MSRTAGPVITRGMHAGKDATADIGHRARLPDQLTGDRLGGFGAGDMRT